MNPLHYKTLILKPLCSQDLYSQRLLVEQTKVEQCLRKDSKSYGDGERWLFSWDLSSALKAVWERIPAPLMGLSSAFPAAHSTGFRRNLMETQKAVPDFDPWPVFPPGNLTEFSWGISEIGTFLSVYMYIGLQSTASQHSEVEKKCMTRTSA